MSKNTKEHTATIAKYAAKRQASMDNVFDAMFDGRKSEKEVNAAIEKMAVDVKAHGIAVSEGPDAALMWKLGQA